MKKRGRKKKKELIVGGGGGVVVKPSVVKTEKVIGLFKEEPPDDYVVTKEEEGEMAEPETAQEPAGPDQSLPVASNASSASVGPPANEPEPPPERKATSYINVRLCPINPLPHPSPHTSSS